MSVVTGTKKTYVHRNSIEGAEFLPKLRLNSFFTSNIMYVHSCKSYSFISHYIKPDTIFFLFCLLFHSLLKCDVQVKTSWLRWNTPALWKVTSLEWHVSLMPQPRASSSITTGRRVCVNEAHQLLWPNDSTLVCTVSDRFSILASYTSPNTNVTQWLWWLSVSDFGFHSTSANSNQNHYPGVESPWCDNEWLASGVSLCPAGWAHT